MTHISALWCPHVQAVESLLWVSPDSFSTLYETSRTVTRTVYLQNGWKVVSDTGDTGETRDLCCHVPDWTDRCRDGSTMDLSKAKPKNAMKMLGQYTETFTKCQSYQGLLPWYAKWKKRRWRKRQFSEKGSSPKNFRDNGFQSIFLSFILTLAFTQVYL